MTLPASVTAMVKRAFDRSWREHGSPEATVVAPIAQWVLLPGGYAYDPVVDAITDSNGTVLTDYDSYWQTSTVRYVPVQTTDATQALVLGGLLATGSCEIIVLQDDIAALAASFRVVIGSSTYRARVTRSPAALVWQRITLEAI